MTIAAAAAITGSRDEQTTGTRTATSDAVHDYLRLIGPYRTLTAAEEVDLAQRIEVGLFAADRLARNGDADPDAADLAVLASQGHAAYEHFIRSNLKLVVSVAKRYQGRGLGLMDLVQNGNLGLDRAVKRFDFSRGFRFSTYSVWWIRQAIGASLAADARTIRIPLHTLEKITRIRRIHRELTVADGQDPSEAELAEGAGVKVAELRRLIAADQEPISLEFPADGDQGEMELGDRVIDSSPGPEEIADDVMMRTAVRDCVAALPTRENRLIRMRYGLDGADPMTLNGIGAAMGISKQRARQLERQALTRLNTPLLEGFQ